MSDVPSTAIVVIGLWLFWRGLDRGYRWWLASGFVAGASMAFRESNPICFAPFFAGTVLRRDRNWWALLVGGLAGLGVRIAAYAYFLGDPFFQRVPYVLDLEVLHERLPLYLLATLVFVPGGLALALCYRGRRWPELLVVVAGFFTAYLIQWNYTYSTSTLKNLVNTPRYLLPLVPLMAFGMSESLPRLWARLVERASPAVRAGLERWRPRAVAAWVAGVLVAAIAVHPAFYAWSETQARIRDTIAATIDNDDVLITNYLATRKFLDEIGRKYHPVDSRELSADDTIALIDRHGEVFIVLVDRSDSSWWRDDTARNAKLLEAIEPAPVLLVDEQVTRTDRLRIWRAGRRPARPGAA
jgi:hypothetical protein